MAEPESGLPKGRRELELSLFDSFLLRVKAGEELSDSA